MNFYPSIGIIGLGFVGSAIRNNFNVGNCVIIDTDPAKHTGATYQDIMKTEGIFVCVPSPQLADGSCDSSILEEAIKPLKDYKGVIICKTTAPPYVYERLQKEYQNLVHVPEFLTAANASADYSKQKWVIIGGAVHAWQREAERIIKLTKSNFETYFCSIGEAALTKYFINSFLATKVVIMNEYFQLAESQGYSWENIRRMLALDDRIGNSHLQVPGPDGYYGFGGACFPKDTSALLHLSKSLNINLNILNEAVKKNTLLRLTKPK